jgi:hypothetical protein
MKFPKIELIAHPKHCWRTFLKMWRPNTNTSNGLRFGWLSKSLACLFILGWYQGLQVRIETMYIVPGSINCQQLNSYQWWRKTIGNEKLSTAKHLSRVLDNPSGLIVSGGATTRSHFRSQWETNCAVIPTCEISLGWRLVGSNYFLTKFCF